LSKLKGKTAVVTGGSTGIGFETAKRFLDEGARVIVTGQDEGRLAEAARKLGDGAIAVRADVRSLADIDALAARVREEFGGLDVLFANSGVATFTPIEQVDETIFDTQFDVNVKGLYFTIQRLSGLLNPGASVILNASAVNGKGLAGASVYSATKAAVRSFARSLAAELSPRGVRVNAISPGYVPTPIQGKMGLSPKQIDEFETGITETLPLRRAGRSDEIASAVVFLASGDSSYVTGADLTVDGGFMNV
jgi:NAD(P)-dependent dehydrogenase (short-subunit alcohol dehydrogenase family)